MCHFNLFLLLCSEGWVIQMFCGDPSRAGSVKKSSCPSAASSALLAPACGNGSQNICRRSLTAYLTPHCISCVKHSLPVEPLLQQPDDIRFPVIQPSPQLWKRDQPVCSPTLQRSPRDVQLLHHILSINPVGPLRQIHFFHRRLLFLKWNKAPHQGVATNIRTLHTQGVPPVIPRATPSIAPFNKIFRYLTRFAVVLYLLGNIREEVLE